MSSAFKQSSTSAIITGGFTFDVYPWSTAANWTNGVPGDGAAVTTNITGGGNPSGYDDISSLFLDNLALTSSTQSKVSLRGRLSRMRPADSQITSAMFIRLLGATTGLTTLRCSPCFGGSIAMKFVPTRWSAPLRVDSLAI